MTSLTVRLPPCAGAARTFATYWLVVVWLTVAVEEAAASAGWVLAVAARFALFEIVTEVAGPDGAAGWDAVVGAEAFRAPTGSFCAGSGATPVVIGAMDEDDMVVLLRRVREEAHAILQGLC
jgi:hypothetical protein